MTVSAGQFYNFQLTVNQSKSTLTPQLIISLKISAQRERNHFSLLSWGRTVTAGIRETTRTMFEPINVPVDDDVMHVTM
jgi:hypothetical protein